MRWNLRNYQDEAARRECRERGTKLGRWPGDPEEAKSEVPNGGVNHTHGRGCPESGAVLGSGVRNGTQRDVDVSGVVSDLRFEEQWIQQHLKEVAELLPCTQDNCMGDSHSIYCPAHYRDAVAAWARQREAQWQNDCDAFSELVDKQGTRADTLEAELAALRKRLTEVERQAGEINDALDILDLCQVVPLVQTLQAERDAAHVALEKFAEGYSCHCSINYPGSTEYHGHDCRNAVVQEFVAQFIAAREGK